MTGKAYQLKEMKGIVDYVVEHKRYSETRGRKMWMDFANSSATTRTWQSLKETFLKRILPDIHNPYYKLTRDQVCSFQQGCDVQAKEKNNRLEIRSASPDPKEKAADNQTDQDQASTSNKNGNEVEKAPGMDIKHAKITSRNRSSADTVILEGEAENIHDEENEKIKQKNQELIESAKAVLGDIDETSKSLKDCLEFEYTEPAMTPLVRGVINDFETESEGSDNEPQIETAETLNTDTAENVANILADENDDTNASDLIIIDDIEVIDGVEESHNDKDKASNEDGHEVEVGPVFEEEVITESINDWLKDCAQQDNSKTKDNPDTNAVNENGGEYEIRPQSDAAKIDEPITIDPENTAEIIARAKEGDKKSIDNGDKHNKNSLSTTADTIIPNNQEVLDENITKSQNKTNTSPDVTAYSKDTATRKRSISQDKNESKKQKVNGEKEVVKENQPKTNGEASVIEINSANTIDTEEACNAQKKDVVDDCLPCTSKQAKQMDVKMLVKNPCLQSVSLFEEQFNTTKYSDSDVETPITNNVEKDKPTQETPAKLPAKDSDQAPTLITQAETTTNKVETTVAQKVIVLKSESDSDETRQVPRKEPEKLTLRYKHLSKAFGFAAGPSASTQRRRSLRCRTRKSKSQRNSFTLRSDSSQWETGSASDVYVSPPRGRRNKQARKYLKPTSARIIPLDEDGGLVVVHRNRIYPLVKDGRNIKSYVTYDAGSGSEEEDNNFWRQKYVEEKKKAAELQRQLNQAQAQTQVGPSQSKSPILQANTKRNASNKVSNVQAPSELITNNKMDIAQVGSSGKIQITLSKSNEEAINLEGHWPQVLPIVQQVMSIFYQSNGQEAKEGESCKMLAVNHQDAKVAASDQNAQRQIDSGQTTPIIPVIDLSAPNKVEELENAIFKEIEEIDKVNGKDTVTVFKRRVGRPRKTPSTNSDQSEPAKKQRKSRIKAQDKTQPLETAHTDGNPDTGLEPTKTRSKAKKGATLEKTEGLETEPKSTEDKAKESETIKSIELPVTRTQTRKSGKSGNETDSSSRTTRLSAKRAEGSDDETRYMLPPEPKRKSAPKKAGSSDSPHEISHDRSTLSVDSMQGYQDTDASPVNINTKRRKISLTVRKGKFVTRRKSTPSNHDLSLDSSNSSYFVPIKKSQTTLDSAIYKTESYQLLMQNRKISTTKLNAIEETSAVNNDVLKDFKAVSNSSDISNIVIEICSSSNVSLPLSPELSVVENLSISREMIQDKHNPTINEMQRNDSTVGNIYNQYLMSDIDVSVPLMQQGCRLLNSLIDISNEPKPQPESETMNSVAMNDLSKSLDTRLKELLLESAKKTTVTNNENARSQPMEVDESKVETAKKKGKKRCSTPQKRNTKKTKVNKNPVIDEHMEFCSRGGRNSCPPVITFVPSDENANNSSDVQLTKKPIKKNIIKVKIIRPKSQRIANKTRIEKTVSTSRASVYTDSGINETASISRALEPSSEMDLIHNHSETCVHANECVCDSIELLDTSKSIISLNSTASLEDELLKMMEDVEKLSGNRRTWEIANKSAEDVFLTPTETAYHSPVASNTSILTEDLSDEAQNDTKSPPTKWYLLTEDETNTNSRPEPTTSRITQFTSNLKQLFPIACAVPNLSTISEMSKENENSRKTGLEDMDTQGSDYQSLFE